MVVRDGEVPAVVQGAHGRHHVHVDGRHGQGAVHRRHGRLHPQLGHPQGGEAQTLRGPPGLYHMHDGECLVWLSLVQKLLLLILIKNIGT